MDEVVECLQRENSNMAAMNADLTDFLQGTSEVALYKDEVNYYAIELEEYAKDAKFMERLGEVGRKYFDAVVPQIQEFNLFVKDFEDFCVPFKDQYLATSGDCKARDDVMLSFVERVEEIRDMANGLFDETDCNLVEYVEEFHDHWFGCASNIQRTILERQTPYKYSTEKPYVTEDDAVNALHEKIDKIAMNRLEFLGESWYPKYTLALAQ
jgi:hypothetical protein